MGDHRLSYFNQDMHELSFGKGSFGYVFSLFSRQRKLLREINSLKEEFREKGIGD